MGWTWVGLGFIIAAISIRLGELALEGETQFRLRWLLAVCASIVIAFGFLYYRLSSGTGTHFGGHGHTHGSFWDFLYFSIVTFATVGFGDIVPMSVQAKLLVVTQIATEFVFIVVFFSGIYRRRTG